MKRLHYFTGYWRARLGLSLPEAAPIAMSLGYLSGTLQRFGRELRG